MIIHCVIGQTHTRSSLYLCSEIYGGVKGVHAQDLHIFNSRRGMRIITTSDTGSFVKDVYISNVIVKNVNVGIVYWDIW